MKTTLRLILVPVCTAISAALTGWLSRHFPGIDLPARDVTALMVAGALAGASGALHWLSRQPKLVELEDDAKHKLDEVIAALKTSTGPALSDIELALKSHAAEILNGIAVQLHAPQSIIKLLDSIVQAVESQKSSPEPAPAADPTAVAPPVQ